MLQPERQPYLVSDTARNVRAHSVQLLSAIGDFLRTLNAVAKKWGTDELFAAIGDDAEELQTLRTELVAVYEAHMDDIIPDLPGAETDTD